MTNDNYYITTQTHQLYDTKLDIWHQIHDSYSGGVTYRDGDYLHKFTLRESDNSYEERKKRAIFFNNVQPLGDMLSGFLFTNKIIRQNYKQQDIVDNINKVDNIDVFMRSIALNSLMTTCGVLVDSPKFIQDEIKTEADRKNAGLVPYSILYFPWQIRNYYVDEYNNLKWVLLDNSYIDNSDPFIEVKTVYKYTLWTDKYYQDFIYEEKGSLFIVSPPKFEAQEPILHPVGYVPFKFINWQNRTNSKIEATIFEDIALFDQAIYNYMSLSDEMMTAGTFKFLFYPNSAHESLKTVGFSNLSVIPFPDESPHIPYFDGPKLGDIDPFIRYIEFLLAGILKKLGLGTDEQKNYQQSGRAKEFDFAKTKALLSSGANQMQEVEKFIFKTSGAWRGIDDKDVLIEYQTDFLGKEIEEEIVRYTEAMTLPYDVIKKASAKMLIKRLFDGAYTDKEIKEMQDQIDEDEEKENFIVEENENDRANNERDNISANDRSDKQGIS